MDESIKWDARFIDLAKHVAQWSKDPSTKCGAVIVREKRVISVGFNGLPSKINDEETILNDRETKLKTILHAEVNAILFSKVDLSGCTIYTHPFQPCSRCASLIIQSGIVRVIAPLATKEQRSRWEDEFRLAERLFHDAGIVFITQ